MATRWACLGTGAICNDFFTALQANLPTSEHKCVAVGSRDLSRAKQFAEKYNFQKAYGSYDEVASNTEVEVVYIGTSSTSHVQLSIKMLEAGKHVLCEKPMAMNTKQAKLVIELAQSKKLLFVEAMWSRFCPAYKRIREELSAGSLGEVRLVTCDIDVCFPAHIPTSEGGGACMCMGMYPIQLACLVYRDMPETITAVGNIGQDGQDEGACIILKYKDGGMASLTYHQDVQGTNTACIMGRKGRIDINDMFVCPTRITTPSGVYEYPLKTGEYNYYNSAGLHYEAATVREYIKKGCTESELFSHVDSIMVSTIMDEVRRQIGMVYPDFE